MKPHAPELLFVMVSDHSNWQLRREIQIALLRSEKTPLERAQKFEKNFSARISERHSAGTAAHDLTGVPFESNRTTLDLRSLSAIPILGTSRARVRFESSKRN